MTKDDIKRLASKEDIRTLEKKITDSTAALHKRVNEVEEMVTECRKDIASNSQKITDQDGKVKITDGKIDDKLKELEFKDLQRDIYDRRLNLLIFGMVEKKGVYGDSNAESLQKIKNLLAEMEVEDYENINIIDCHRLPQKKRVGDDEKPRPIIFKVSDMFDLRRITDKKAKLKELSKSKNFRLGVGKHFPKAIIDQKKQLQEKFDDLYRQKMKPRWHFNHATLKFSIQDNEGKTLAE